MMNTIFVLIKCELGKANDVAAHLIDEIAGVSEVYSISGEYDLIAKFNIPRDTDMGRFVTGKVQAAPNIRETFTIMTFSPFGPATTGG
jgi:DNA-binding Lrp family transcriptional regulator